MLDCPRCAAPLPLTLPTCSCGADVPSAADGVGLACDACHAWNPPGTGRCSACGAPLGSDPELPLVDLELAPEEDLASRAEPSADREEVGAEPQVAAVAAPEVTSGREVPAEDAFAAQDTFAAEDAFAAEVGGGTAHDVAEEPPASAPPRPSAAPEQPPGPPVLQRTGRARGATIHQARPAAPAGLRVTAVRPDGSAATAVVGTAPLLCGRSDGDLLVPGDTVSRHHARITQRDGRTVVEDLGSLNGTWIRLRAPRAVAYGDELRIGERRLRLAFTPGGAALEEIATGGATLAAHALGHGATVVGAAGDVRLDGVEPSHARIEATAAGHAVTDLGSRTGTWLRLAAPEPIAPGDELLLGAERLRVEEA